MKRKCQYLNMSCALELCDDCPIFMAMETAKKQKQGEKNERS